MGRFGGGVRETDGGRAEGQGCREYSVQHHDGRFEGIVTHGCDVRGHDLHVSGGGGATFGERRRGGRRLSSDERARALLFKAVLHSSGVTTLFYAPSERGVVSDRFQTKGTARTLTPRGHGETVLHLCPGVFRAKAQNVAQQFKGGMRRRHDGSGV